MRPVRYARPYLTVMATAATMAAGFATAGAAFGVVPPTPQGLPSGAEDLVRYVAANTCDTAVKPGSEAWGDLLVATYPDTHYSLQRPCGTNTLPTSEHYDGRAVDWNVSVRKSDQRAEAQEVIDWLMATDSHGNTYANARRLGVMYLIWNNKKWSSWDPGRWTAYRNCASRPSTSLDSYCHRNHIHFSLSWAGAMKRTSFWTGNVAPMDWGPCRPADLNWASRYTKPRANRCPVYPPVLPEPGASSTERTLVRFSGVWLSVGSTGPVVKALQQQVGAGADGVFGPLTKAAVQSFQGAHGVRASGSVDAATWRALLERDVTPPAATTPPPPPSNSGTYAKYEGVRLAYGSRGTTVKVLQKALGMRAYDQDGIFGPRTRTAVITYQKRARLTANGIVTRPVWQALGGDTAGPPPTSGTYARYEGVRLAYGSRGTTVKVLQKALGMSAYDQDGIFGPRTRTAVITYQKRARLTANGIVTRPVWRALG